MKRKSLFLTVTVSFIALLFASVGFANVDAPPVNQTIGKPDIAAGDYVEAECRVCHPGVLADKHHIAAQEADPELECLDCHTVGVDPVTGIITINVIRDCLVCHTSSPHHGTGNAATMAGDCVSCHGDLVDNFDDGHAIPTYSPSLVTPGPKASVCEGTGYSCGDDSYCGDDVCSTKRISCSVDDDCDVGVCANSKIPCTDNSECHPGHCSDTGADCYLDDDCPTGSCRSEELCLTADDDECIEDDGACVASHAVPTEPGGCNYCHDAGTDSGSGIEVLDSYGTHHGASVRRVQDGETSRCYTCHTHDGYRANDIRKCEECHGYASLHNIAVDTAPNNCSDTVSTACTVDTDCPGLCEDGATPCTSDSPDCDGILGGTCDLSVGETCGELVVGAEDAGFSHVGAAADCDGCHGFNARPASLAPGGGPVTPDISDISVTVVMNGADTQVTLTGAAFTNVVSIYGMVINYSSEIRLTAADGSTTTLTPDAISQGSITVTIPGSTAPGNYDLQAVKNSSASAPVVLTVIPKAVIDNVECKVSCSLSTFTITGSGFGKMPEGTYEDFNVVKDGVLLVITSWTDTVIKAHGNVGCSGTIITVNTLYDSASK